jgi:hypothetical protein
VTVASRGLFLRQSRSPRRQGLNIHDFNLLCDKQRATSRPGR